MYRLRWCCWAILNGGRFGDLRTIYQGCRALPFALARLSCYIVIVFVYMYTWTLYLHCNIVRLCVCHFHHIKGYLTWLDLTWMDPVNVSVKFEVRSFTSSWDNSHCSFGLRLRTPNLGEGEAVGGLGRYRSKERWWVTFHLSLRVSETLPLLCCSTPFFPTPPHGL